jgi:hypothetical protein
VLAQSREKEAGKEREDTVYNGRRNKKELNGNVTPVAGNFQFR